MTTTAIVTAAGSGSRMGSDLPKQFLPLADVPLLIRTLRVFEDAASVDTVLPVVPADHLARATELIAAWRLRKCLPPVAGGPRRQDSVRIGFECCRDDDLLLIHDGARPLLDADLIERCLASARSTGAALCAVRPPETVKYSPDGMLVERTLDRSLIWLAQTPQAFRRQVLAEAYRRADFNREFTDEASLVEAAGFPVALVPGSPDNLKITSPHDLAVAEALLTWAGRAAGTAS